MNLPIAVVRTAAELAALPRTGRRVVVMTMGALHEGHATLIRAARARADEQAAAYSTPEGRTPAESVPDGQVPDRQAPDRQAPDGQAPRGQVVVTVFVNPLQFGAGEDLDRYPRTLEADLLVALEAGADAVFAPSADEVYPGGEPQVRITAGPMGERLEGATRPGHFDGMLTVVAKLLHLTAPDVALYGQKDAQQLALIRRMARDLNFPVTIEGVPTVREDSGLALSSRNRYLSESERRTALSLSTALFAGRDLLAARQTPYAHVREQDPAAAARARAGAPAAPGPEREAADARAVQHAPRPAPAAVREAARAVLDEAARLDPPLVLDYLALVDPSDFTEVPDDHTGDAVLAVAAKVGTTRLIDNLPLVIGADADDTAHRAGATQGAAQ
ncbi:4-phosphopantoate--beta-alanine ligase [Streptomyces sp. NPDC058657]|uniref:4-phosphopantoate--beta-alanine ligase n=1 Tax=unclassified Streptomyces TaxID=2593676 RepID=UPI003651030E